MTSVERILEYQNIDAEDELESPENRKPPPSWPAYGEIFFDKLSLRYLPDPTSEYVLKELDFDVLPSEKIGIVGRTGMKKIKKIVKDRSKLIELFKVLANLH